MARGGLLGGLVWLGLVIAAVGYPPAFQDAARAGVAQLGLGEDDQGEGGLGRHLLMNKQGKILSQKFKMIAKHSKKLNPKGKMGKEMSHGKCTSGGCLKKKMAARKKRKKAQKKVPTAFDHIQEHDKLLSQHQKMGTSHLLGAGALAGR